MRLGCSQGRRHMAGGRRGTGYGTTERAAQVQPPTGAAAMTVSTAIAYGGKFRHAGSSPSPSWTPRGNGSSYIADDGGGYIIERTPHGGSTRAGSPRRSP